MRGSDLSSAWPARLALTVTSRTGEQRLQTRLVGAHWLNSVLAAYTAAEQCGVAPADIAASINKVQPFRGRMQPVALPNGATAISDQNASRDVFEAMAAVAAGAEGVRKLVVLGDLNDTALNGSKARRKYAGRIVAESFDVAFFFGKSAQKARNAAITAGMCAADVHCAATLAEADALLKTELRPGNLVFIKGKNLYHLHRLIYLQYGAIGCRKESCTIRSDCEICPQLQPEFDLASVTAAPAA